MSQINNIQEILDTLSLINKEIVKEEIEVYISEKVTYYKVTRTIQQSVSFDEGLKKIDKCKNMDNKIFIVHGRNDSLKHLVEAYLLRIGLEPIILSEKGGGAYTLIEKFKEFAKVQYAIVLLTDDDEGKIKIDGDLKPRARQNVIFEMGYFMAKKGSKNIFLLSNNNSIELPSDIAGIEINYIELEWKDKFKQFLRKAGFVIDYEKI